MSGSIVCRVIHRRVVPGRIGNSEQPAEAADKDVNGGDGEQGVEIVDVCVGNGKTLRQEEEEGKTGCGNGEVAQFADGMQGLQQPVRGEYCFGVLLLQIDEVGEQYQEDKNGGHGNVGRRCRYGVSRQDQPDNAVQQGDDQQAQGDGEAIGRQHGTRQRFFVVDSGGDIEGLACKQSGGEDVDQQQDG